MTQQNEAGGWLVVEMVGEDRSVVFDTDRTKNFSSLTRRQRWSKPPVNAAINEAIDELRLGSKSARRTVHVPGRAQSIETLTVVARPVLGPPEDWNGNSREPAVLGAQVWIGRGDLNPQTPRAVGAFVWDPSTHLTGQGASVDLDILEYPEHRGVRPSSEVFKNYIDFPRQIELGEYAASVAAGEVELGSEFAAEITLRALSGTLKRVAVSMRACVSEVRAGEFELRGLIHDISDVRAPVQASGNLAAREMAALIDSPATGVATVDLAVNVVLEWLKPPPSSVHQWTQAAPEWKSPDDVADSVASLVAGRVTAVQFDTEIRFDADPWQPVTITLRALVRRPDTGGGTGIMFVVCRT